MSEDPREIVFIDDEPALAGVMARVLATRPEFRVLDFTESAAALQWLASHTPALVITDHTMPGPSGLDVARTLRAQPHTRAVPILMLSGYGEPELQEEALAAGVDLVARKPLGMVELLALIDLLLRRPRSA